jgi:hypothetical protein
MKYGYWVFLNGSESLAGDVRQCRRTNAEVRMGLGWGA